MTNTLNKMLEKCTNYGLLPTENFEKIARAKDLMFGEDSWAKCPCDSNNLERFCLSDLCRRDIEKDGICHCRCYKK